MVLRYGIDTSVLIRLIIQLPEDLYIYCLEQLTALREDEGAEVYASNQVIGEAYITVQHHYKVSRERALYGLLEVFHSGLVTPLNGEVVIAILEAPNNPGVFDRLIADGYSQRGLETLTLDRRMSRLSGVQRL